MSIMVLNLATQQEKRYFCSPQQAVIAAHAQANKDFNTWNYWKRYGHLLQEGEYTFSCGDWTALKVDTHIKRILTPADRLLHIAWCREKDRRSPWGMVNDSEYYEYLGDQAAINSNMEHDPTTGYMRFKADAPAWVRELAGKRNLVPAGERLCLEPAKAEANA